MVSIFKKPTKKVANSYNGMDLSKSIKFTSSVGHLLPVLYDRLDPGDFVDLKAFIFTRTQPLNSAAFTRVTEHIDYFFVPTKLINSFFNDQFYGIQDQSSSLMYLTPNITATSDDTKLATGVPACLPLVRMQSLFNMVKDLNTNKTDYGEVDEFGVPVCYNFFRLASLLGYSEAVGLSRIGKNNNTSFKFINPLISLDLFFAYQRIFSDYYRLSTWQKNNPLSYSSDYLVSKLSQKEDPYSYDGSILPLLHLSKNKSSGVTTFLNYNINSPFCLRYRPWKRDYFTNVEPSPLYNPSQYSVYRHNAGTPAILSELGVMSSSSAAGSFVSDQDSYFYSKVLDEFPGDDTLQRDDNPFTPFLSSSAAGGITLAGFRTLLAWEKLSTVTNRAKKHYVDQTLAHFGVKVPQGISEEVYYLGGQSSRLVIGEVLATATTGSGPDSSVLGEIGGKGMSSNTNGKKIRFKAPCHGILMAIYSAVPESDYEAFGLDRLNTYASVMDYYHPEFDRLGYQPLYKTEYDVRLFDTDTVLSEHSATAPSDIYLSNNKVLADIIGWQYRYSETKTKYDTIHGAFLYTLQNWVTPRDSSLVYVLDNAAAIPFAASGALSYFYINPCSLDRITELSFKPTNYKVIKNTPFIDSRGNSHDYYNPSIVYSRDPLLHNIDFMYHKSTKKSVYGLPV